MLTRDEPYDAMVDVNCTINGVENFGGFVLFIENGVMKCLEGYTFTDKWPDVITSYHLEESTIGYEQPQCDKK